MSSDRTEQAMLDYMRESHGGWPAVPHGSPASTALSSLLGVRGIPALVVVARDATVIAQQGRQDVLSLGSAAFAQWQQLAPLPLDCSVVELLRDNPPEVRTGAAEVLLRWVQFCLFQLVLLSVNHLII